MKDELYEPLEELDDGKETFGIVDSFEEYKQKFADEYVKLHGASLPNKITPDFFDIDMVEWVYRRNPHLKLVTYPCIMDDGEVVTIESRKFYNCYDVVEFLATQKYLYMIIQWPGIVSFTGMDDINFRVHLLDEPRIVQTNFVVRSA